MIFALVIDPGHAEHHDALGLDNALEDLLLTIFRLRLDKWRNGFQDFLRGLKEFAFPRITSAESIQHLFYVGIHVSLLSGVVHIHSADRMPT